ncbi:MAG: chromosomal replication initiation protein DnaA, partial [Thermoleophilia bacterium]|nr:chromosomal replication initiation protein DnaA [Thermoleophilia bacterium]
RTTELTMPRHIAMYLARVMLNAPSTQVGKRFGGKDHSTVLSAEKKIEALIRKDPEVFALIERLTESIRKQADGVQHAR